MNNKVVASSITATSLAKAGINPEHVRIGLMGADRSTYNLLKSTSILASSSDAVERFTSSLVSKTMLATEAFSPFILGGISGTVIAKGSSPEAGMVGGGFVCIISFFFTVFGVSYLRGANRLVGDLSGYLVAKPFRLLREAEIATDKLLYKAFSLIKPVSEEKLKYIHEVKLGIPSGSVEAADVIGKSVNYEVFKGKFGCGYSGLRTSTIERGKNTTLKEVLVYAPVEIELKNEDRITHSNHLPYYGNKGADGSQPHSDDE